MYNWGPQVSVSRARFLVQVSKPHLAYAHAIESRIYASHPSFEQVPLDLLHTGMIPIGALTYYSGHWQQVMDALGHGRRRRLVGVESSMGSRSVTHIRIRDYSTDITNRSHYMGHCQCILERS